jgi:hypothetical protein
MSCQNVFLPSRVTGWRKSVAVLAQASRSDA